MSLTEVNLNDIINGMESEQTTLRYSLGEGLKGRKDSVSVRRYTSRVPHGEPYAGILHVRFDEGYPQSRRRVAKRCTSRGAGVPHGASRSTLHPRIPRERSLVADAAA